jgi:environmental stress-induced protein Ves
MRRWSSSDYREMPWRNGGGSTTEMAVFPEGASMDDFVWRLSAALVNHDGPFSIFTHIDRSLAVLNGAGLSLTGAFENQSMDKHQLLEVELNQASNPFRFAGDIDVMGRLLDGPIRDLNLMTQRNVCSHYMQRLLAGEHHIQAEQAQQVLLFCAQGQALLNGNVKLMAEDLLLLEEKKQNQGIHCHLSIPDDAIVYYMRIQFLNHGGSDAALG